MKIVSFAALDTLISVVLFSSAAVHVAADLVRKRSQVNHLSGQQKREENYADHDVRQPFAVTSVATEVVDGTVARMVEASTSLSSSPSIGGSRSRSLIMSMPARCSFCDGGMPDPDLVLPTDNGATCGMAKAYASTLEVSDSNCQVALLAESICCPAHDTAGTSTPKSYAPTPEPASYAPTPEPASYAPTPEPASYAPNPEPATDAPTPAAATTKEVSPAYCTCSDGVTVPFPFYGDPTICYEWFEYDWCNFEYETMYCCRVVMAPLKENNGRAPPAASSAVAVISAMAVVLAIYCFRKRTSGNRSNNPERIEEGVPTVVATKVENPTDEAPFPRVKRVQVEWSPPPPSVPQLNPNECPPPPPSAPPLEYSASRCG